MDKRQAYEQRHHRPRQSVNMRLLPETVKQWRALTKGNPDLTADDILARLLSAPELLFNLALEASERGYDSKHHEDMHSVVQLFLNASWKKMTSEGEIKK